MDAPVSRTKTRDYYLHPPGMVSRTGVIDVGLKCATATCPFCFYLHLNGEDDPSYGMKHAKFHTREHLFTLCDSLADHKFLVTDITGGEPTLHPDIIDLIAHATERGLATRIITLGPYLQRPMHKRKGRLIDELLSAGLTDFRLSVHSIDEAYWKQRLSALWQTQLANMNALDELNFQFMTNTTITLDNYKSLPAIAREISRHNVYNATILFMMAHYEWSSGRAGEIQAKYTEAAPYCREFVDILEAEKIAVVVRYAPLCTIKGMEKNHSGAIGVRFDPQEWMNRINHKADPAAMTHDISYAMGMPITQAVGEPSDGLNLIRLQGDVGGHKIIAGRDRPDAVAKVFPAECTGCSAAPVCDGLESQYLRAHGGGEMLPYPEPSPGNVLHRERLRYYPSYIVKLRPYADVKAAVRQAFSW